MSDLFRALAVLAEPPCPETTRIAAALGLPRAPDATAFTHVFVLQLPPYASIYTGAEGAIGGEARDRVAGFWRAIGLEPPAEPDHLAVLLGLHAALADRDAAGAASAEPHDGWVRARAALLWEHLASWLVPYLGAVDRLAPEEYVAWSACLREALRAEAARRCGWSPLPLHLRAAPTWPAEDEGADAWIGALLSPVRSGIVLARADLARAGWELGVGVPARDRRIGLRGLLETDPAGTCAWLAAEAQRAAGEAAEGAGPLAAIGEFWAGRARATAARMEQAAKGGQVFQRKT